MGSIAVMGILGVPATFITADRFLFLGGQDRIPVVPKCVFPRDSLGLFCIWLIWCL